MALVVAGQAHHHRHGAGLGEHGIQHRQLLGVIERRGFAGAAAHDQPVDARRHEMAHQAAQGPAIDSAAGERRHQGIQTPWNGD